MKIQDLLAKLKPLQELDAIAREGLLAKLKLTDLEAGERLVSQQTQSDLIYLAMGKLRLRNTDEGRDLNDIQGGSNRSLQPLFDGQANYLAIAEVPCKLLRIERVAVEALLKNQRQAGYEIAEVEVSAAQSALFQAIYQACIGNRLELPSMPEVALKIRNMADDPNVGINDLTKVIQTDPTVAARILHAANSALYRGRQEIAGVHEALVRLGLKTTQALAMSIAMGQTFKAHTQIVKKRMQVLWNHSVRISALASVIARKIGGDLNPETALLAGLLHDIGGIPILNFVDRGDTEIDLAELNQTITKLQAMTGRLVMEHWEFGPDLIAVVEGAEDWLRDTGAPPDYTDLIIAAQIYDNASGHQDPAIPPPELAPAFNKLRLGNGTAEAVMQVLAEAEADVAATMALLS